MSREAFETVAGWPVVLRSIAAAKPAIDESSLVVEGVVGVGARLPGGGEGMSGAGDVGDEREVGLRDEVLDLEVAANDETEQRRLHAPDREDPALVARRTAEDGVEPGHVDAVEPIGALSADGRVVEAAELRVRLKGAERLANGGGIEVADEDPIDGASVAEEVEDLVDEQLALPIRVAGVDDDVDAREERLDGLEQIRRLDGELPLARRDGKVLEPPLLEVGVVGVGVGQLEDVAGAPGDDVGAALDVVVAALRLAGGPRRSRARGMAFRR